MLLPTSWPLLHCPLALTSLESTRGCRGYVQSRPMNTIAPCSDSHCISGLLRSHAASATASNNDPHLANPSAQPFIVGLGSLHAHAMPCVVPLSTTRLIHEGWGILPARVVERFRQPLDTCGASICPLPITIMGHTMCRCPRAWLIRASMGQPHPMHALASCPMHAGESQTTLRDVKHRYITMDMIVHHTSYPHSRELELHGHLPTYQTPHLPINILLALDSNQVLLRRWRTKPQERPSPHSMQR